MRQQESASSSQAIRQARAFTVANLTWARIDNWVKDLKYEPCEWSVHQSIPIIGTRTIICSIKGDPFVSLSYSILTDDITPSNENSKARLNDMRQWALQRGSYP